MIEPSAIANQPERETAPTSRKRRTRMRAATILNIASALIGLAAIGTAAWVYSETRREIATLAKNMAEIRVGLDLLSQEPADTADTESTDQLLELSNRLAILEQSWRGSLFAPGDAPAPVAPAGSFTPPAAPAPATGAATPATGDCLPTGTRFMVASGDSYPVCGTTATVQIGAVDNGFLTLADGTVIAQGATVGLPASQCMIAVVPSDGGSLSGFAEIRVTC